MKNNNINIIPIISYFNSEILKILKDNNNNKSGVYRWNNLIRGKSYISNL